MGMIAMFLLPLLWSIWVLYALFRPVDAGIGKLLLFWACIDIVMLGCFGLFWYGDNSWLHTPGADMLVLVLECPLVLPLLALPPHWVLPLTGLINQATKKANPLMGETLAAWVGASLSLLPVTLLLVVLSQVIFHLRMGRMEKNKPVKQRKLY